MGLFPFLLDILRARSWLLVLLNLLFFGGVLFFAVVSLFWAEFYPFKMLDGVSESFSLDAGFLALYIANIFASNFFMSGLLMLTLSGFVFFLFPVGFLVLRAWVWGFLLNQLSTRSFLLVIPTLILEGEGYVMAALAGIVLGLSWLKPSWIYGGKVASRREALRLAARECMLLYVVVVILLLLAAVVEAVTIHML